MTAPTERALSAWWTAKTNVLGPTARLTCADCGRVDSSAYVQPQHPYYAGGREDVAWCSDCITVRNQRAQAERKAQRAARPPDCARCGRRPHTWVIGAGYRLCGRCKTLTLREHAAALAHAGSLAIFATGLLVDRTGWAEKQGGSL